MENRVHSLDRPADRRAVDQVAPDELDLVADAFQVGQEAGREVIQHADTIASLDQGLDEMGADEPGPAGD